MLEYQRMVMFTLHGTRAMHRFESGRGEEFQRVRLDVRRTGGHVSVHIFESLDRRVVEFENCARYFSSESTVGYTHECSMPGWRAP